MSIRTISSFKTSDNTIFENRSEAETHETMLAIRGIIQTKLGTSIHKHESTPTNIAHLMVKGPDSFYNVLLALKRKKAAQKGKLTKNLAA